MKRMVKSCIVAFTLAVSLGTMAEAKAWTTDFWAPGIGSPGNPKFTTGGTSAALVGSAKSGYTLTLFGVDPSTAKFTLGKTTYNVHNEIIELTAHFDSKGDLLTGLKNTIEIFGSVPVTSNSNHGTKWSPIEDLFSAKLTGVGVDASKVALGFSTDDFSGWAAKYAPPDPSESLWLYSLNAPGHRPSWISFLEEIQDHSALHDAIFKNLGSITTVPLPASVILLLGGLAGLCGIVRVRQRPGTWA